MIAFTGKSRKTLVGTQYEYIRFTVRADHHPSVEDAFTITETIDKDTSFEIKYVKSYAWCAPFVTTTTGAGISSNNRSNGTLEYSYWGTTAYSDYTSGTSAILANGVYRWEKNKLYANEVLKYTGTTPSTSSTGLKIAHSDYGDSRDGLDLYYIKIWQNGVLTNHFVPCVSSETGESGMYDIIKKEFKASARPCTMMGDSSDLKV